MSVEKQHAYDRVKSFLKQCQDSENRHEEGATEMPSFREIQDALSEAEKVGLEEMEVADLLDRFGSYLWKSPDLQGAKVYYKKALKVLETRGNSTKVKDARASTHTNLGNVLYDEGDFEEASNQQHLAIELFRGCYGDFHPILANCYKTLGFIEAKHARFTSAIDFYQKALRCVSEEEHPDVIAEIYCAIGIAWKEIGKREEAASYIERCLTLQMQASGAKNAQSIGIRAFQLGLIYEELANLKQAKRYFAISLTHFRELVDSLDKKGLLYCLQHLGSVCFASGLLSEAKGYYEQLNVISRNMKDDELFNLSNEMITKCANC
jgi:tetratricopeptide (TPR) repeat protein